MASCSAQINDSSLSFQLTNARNRRRDRPTRTHPILGLLVGAGVQQQSHELCIIIPSGIHQRRASVLRARVSMCQRRSNQRHTRTRTYMATHRTRIRHNVPCTAIRHTHTKQRNYQSESKHHVSILNTVKTCEDL